MLRSSHIAGHMQMGGVGAFVLGILVQQVTYFFLFMYQQNSENVQPYIDVYK